MSDEYTTMVELLEAVQNLTREFQKLRQSGATPQQDYLSINQVAAITGFSQKHIRRAIKDGILPCSDGGGVGRPTYRIARSAVDTWMTSKREVGPTNVVQCNKVAKYFPRMKDASTKD